MNEERKEERKEAGFYLGFNLRGCEPKAGVPSLPPSLSPTRSLPALPAPPLPLEVGPLKTS